MGKRLGIAGYQNSGKSFTRRYIPDGENAMVISPSIKASYLYTGPKDADSLTPKELDLAIKEGKRKMLGDFDMTHPEGKYKNSKEAIRLLATIKGPGTDLFSVMANMLKHKAPGYLKPQNILGNTIYAPRFEQMVVAAKFVDIMMPWIHTLILPDFTHFITDKLTSDEFLNRKHGGEAFARYLDLAADAFKSFIKASDTMRKDLIVVTEYHVEENKEQGCYELFVPGGKMVKEKFLPSSYYDVFLFTDVKYETEDDDAEAHYRYVTRKTRKYPEARSGGLFEDMYVDNNLYEVLQRMRKEHNIPIPA